MRIEYVQPGMTLAHHVLDEQGNLLLEERTVLSELYLRRLKRLGIRALSVIDRRAAELKCRPVVPEDVRQNLATCFQVLFALRLRQELNLTQRLQYVNQLEQAIQTVIAHVEPRLADIVNMQIRQPAKDEVTHAVNVCLLSVITGLYLRFPPHLLHDLALGALLHDIGKSDLALDQQPLTDHPYIHSLYGHKLLLKNGFSPIVAQVAAEHHEKHDGSGYPLGLTGRDSHPLSRLVAIANHYDNAMKQAIIQGVTCQDIVEEMLAQGNTNFDLSMLRAFFHIIAVYPVGSLVRLNTGELAYVMENKMHLPLRPTVELFDSRQLDLVLQSNITITELIEE